MPPFQEYWIIKKYWNITWSSSEQGTEQTILGAGLYRSGSNWTFRGHFPMNVVQEEPLWLEMHPRDSPQSLNNSQHFFTAINPTSS